MQRRYYIAPTGLPLVGWTLVLILTISRARVDLWIFTTLTALASVALLHRPQFPHRRLGLAYSWIGPALYWAAFASLPLFMRIASTSSIEDQMRAVCLVPLVGGCWSAALTAWLF